MAYNEDLVRMKTMVSQLVMTNVASPESKELLEGVLIQILNESERNRQTCMAAADNFKKQAAVMEGQSAAFASLGSIASSVLTGFILVAEKNKEEESRRNLELIEMRHEQEKLEKETKPEAVQPEEPKPDQPAEVQKKSKKR